MKFSLDTCNFILLYYKYANSQLSRVELIDLEIKHGKK